MLTLAQWLQPLSEAYSGGGKTGKKDWAQIDREINELIMSLPADPSKPPQPPAPARLEDAKAVEEVDAYLLSLSADKPDNQ